MTPRLNSFLVGTVGFSLFASAAFAQAPAADPVAPTAQPPAPSDPGALAPAPPADPAPAPAPAPEPAPVLEPAVPVEPPKKPGPPSFKIEAGEGTNLKLGVLLQPQFQAQGDVALDGWAMNLFVRRARLLVGGTLFGAVDYFVDTDFANMMFGNPVAGNADAIPPTPGTTVKSTPGMNIQDAFVTLKPLGNDVFKVDLGYMLPPMSHNAVQSAASLYSWDYFSYAFVHSNVFGTSQNPVGRDTGVQVRGLVVDDHLEYRVGLFQGKRRGASATEVGSQNMFRATGRVQVNVLDPETGFFYGGSYLGTKSILSFGATFDVQDDYTNFGGDAFVDLPVGPGVFTAQANFIAFDGGDWVPLDKGTAFMSELGFNFTDVHVAPIARFEMGMPDEGPKETRWALGAAYFPYGHNLNLKAFFGQRTVEDADHAANQFNLQCQVYVF